jgi:hypothetical protein
VDGRPRGLLLSQPDTDKISERLTTRRDLFGTIEAPRLYGVATFPDEILDAFAFFARLREFNLADTERALDTSVPVLQLPRCRTAIQLTEIKSPAIA